MVSLGHEVDFAHCHQEARGLFDRQRHSYCLINWELPATPDDDRREFQVFLNLLDEINPLGAKLLLPVIGMIDHAPAGVGAMASALTQAISLRERGVVAFVPKPFPTFGLTLEQVVKDMLAARLPPLAPIGQEAAERPKEVPSPAVPVAPQPPTQFTGGELVFFPDRVELDGVKIIGDGGARLSLRLMEALALKMPSGHWRGLGGGSLAREIGADSEAVVINCVYTIRDNAVDRMLKQRNVLCKRDSIIGNDLARGYHFRSNITVRRVGAADPPPPVAAGVPEREGAMDRRDKILSILKARPLRVPELSAAVHLAPKTVHRTLAEMKRDGLVEFVGAPKTGSYRIKRKQQPKNGPAASQGLLGHGKSAMSM